MGKQKKKKDHNNKKKKAKKISDFKKINKRKKGKHHNNHDKIKKKFPELINHLSDSLVKKQYNKKKNHEKKKKSIASSSPILDYENMSDSYPSELRLPKNSLSDDSDENIQYSGKKRKLKNKKKLKKQKKSGYLSDSSIEDDLQAIPLRKIPADRVVASPNRGFSNINMSSDEMEMNSLVNGNNKFKGIDTTELGILNPNATFDRQAHTLVDDARFDHLEYPYLHKVSNDDYQRELKLLHSEMVKLQEWVQKTGSKVVIIFEGRDAAGKGGSIKRLMDHLDPRYCRVVALEKPTPTEQGQWYFQRYIKHLPDHGEIVLFDRSWYNRAGVERVMGFCKYKEYLEFLRSVPQFEKMLVNSGTHLFKLWFSVSRSEQARRLQTRKLDPLKQWKLSPMDLEAMKLWDQYTDAKQAMLFHTSSPHAPWTIIRSDDKKRARLNCMRFILSSMPYDKNEMIVNQVDPLIVGPANMYYHHEMDESTWKKDEVNLARKVLGSHHGMDFDPLTKRTRFM